MKVIVDNQDRNILSEGRDFQMGFAFVKKVDSNTFETVQPISPCKDYMNDVVWCEATKNEIQVFGLKYKPTGLWLKEPDIGYFIMGICPYAKGNPYIRQEQHTINLSSNYKNLQKFMQHFDIAVKAKQKTIIVTTDKKGIYLVKFDSVWKESTYMTSLYTLLMRVGQFWDGNKDILTYLTNFQEFDSDIYLLRSVLNKIKAVAAGHKIVQDLAKIKGGYNVHNCGIVSYNLAI